MRRKMNTTVYLTPEQHKRLQGMKAASWVPMTEYIRLGVDLVIAEYERRELSQSAGGVA